MTTLPGFSISILRSQTFAETGRPIVISGRVSAFGLPLPALVRVTLDGPEHDPDSLAFNTFSAPTGDYSVAVQASKDGQYEVFAEAFLPLGLPIPGAPEPLFTGPSFAKSPSPPLSIGRPVDGQIFQDLGDGQTQRVPQPPPTRIEVSAPIAVTIGDLGGGGAPVGFGGFGAPPFLTGFPFPGAPAPAAPAPTPIIVGAPAPAAPAPLPAPAPPTAAPAPEISGRILGFTI